MAKCTYKRFDKIKICRGDLRHKITILQREQGGIGYNELEATENFSTVQTPWAAVRTVRGTTRFKGININERATHLFYIAYTPSLDALEHGNNFIAYKDRMYRILDITNQDEDNQFIFFQCVERGQDDLRAAEA